MKSVLFVCTGNICRSPSADGILRHLVAERGLDITVDSCGTHGYHVGEAPDERSIQTAKQNGVDLSFLSARKLERDDFERFDLLLAMDNGHFDRMRLLCSPQHSHKLHLFLDFLPGHEGQNVPDPYYGSIEGFHHVYDLCLRGCEALLETLQNNRP